MLTRRFVISLVAIASAGFLAAGLSAARGDLDPTFGSGGKATTDFGGRELAWGIALQRDRKIVVAGERFDPGPDDDFVLARYTVTGNLDTSFDGDGKVTTDFNGRFSGAGDVAVQPDGKIVAVGVGFAEPVRPIDFALARYNPDGSLDGSFGVGGKVLTTFAPNSLDAASAVALQPDGKVVAAGRTRASGGRYEFAVARHLPNGALDPSFDGDGLVVTPITAGDDDVFDLVLQPDGKIVAAGWSLGDRTDMAIARYNTDGSLDGSFDGDGIVHAPFAPAGSVAFEIERQSDGKLVIAGDGVVRLNADGGVDRSFGTAGRARAGDVQAVAVELQPDGRILAVGSVFPGQGQGDFAVARLTAAGGIDTTYGRGGQVVTNFGPYDQGTDAELGPDGKLAVSGFTGVSSETGPADFAVARYVAIRFCVVPNVRGQKLTAARVRLTRAGCRTGKIKRKYSSTVKKGRVISQRPRAGARLAELAKVNLVVSRGRRR